MLPMNQGNFKTTKYETDYFLMASFRAEFIIAYPQL